MAQWIGLGLAGIKAAGRAPTRIHKKLRERWPFRRHKDGAVPEPPSDPFAQR
jgi:hypothetical protein